MNERRIQFDRDACCAMTQAFTKNKVLLRWWAAREPELRLLGSIFSQTQDLSFFANPETIDVYLSFARAELRRLTTQQRASLSCSCSSGRHIEALQNVLAQLPRVH